MGSLHYTIEKNLNIKFPFKIFEHRNSTNQRDHSHEYLQLWYVRKGECKHYLNGQEYTCAQHGICIIPPFIEHRIESSADSELICCEFSERFINEALEYKNRGGVFDVAYLEAFFLSENIVDSICRISDEKALVIDKLFSSLLREYNTYSKHSYLFIKADLLKLLAIMASEYDKNMTREAGKLYDKYHDAIDKAILYINEHYSEKIYLEDVCRMAMMSTSSFSHIFKQVVGKTFSEYIMDLRLQRASEMLENSDMALSEICFSCGFSDSNYFSRAFKKKHGLSPSQFRKASKI